MDQTIISGDSGPEAAASRYNPFTGVTHATLPDRLNEEWEQTAAQLAETADQVAAIDEAKANKTEVNALATAKANQSDLLVTEARAVDAQAKANNPLGQLGDYTIPSATDADKIKLVNLSQEVRDAIVGKTTIGTTPAPGSVTPTELANGSATSVNRYSPFPVFY